MSGGNYNAAPAQRRESDAFEKLLWSESTEEEYLKQMVGRKTPEGSDDEGGFDDEKLDDTATLPGAIKAMEGLKIDDEASIVQRRHVRSSLETMLRLGDCDSSDSSEGSPRIEEEDDDDGNNTVDEMIEASEREEETNLHNILGRIPANAEPEPKSAATSTSTKEIRKTINRTFRDGKKKSLTDTMNNDFHSKAKTKQQWDGNDSLAGNETIGKIVTHMMDGGNSTAESYDDRTLRSWTDFQPIAGSVATPIGQQSFGNYGNKFVNDDTSVGSISEDIEVIVAKHKKQLDDEVGEIQNMELERVGAAAAAAASTTTTSNIQDTMVSSLSFDATYYAQVRSQLGVMPSHAEDEDTTIEFDDEEEKDIEQGETEDWWVQAERIPTEQTSSDKTPSPQNSVGKPKDAPDTPSTVIYVGDILGLATPDHSYADPEELKSRDGIIKTKSWGRLAFLKRTSDRYGGFYLWVIVGSLVMLVISVILIIAAVAKLGNKSDQSLPPLLQDPENGKLFDANPVVIDSPPSPISPTLDWTYNNDANPIVIGSPPPLISATLDGTHSNDEKELSQILDESSETTYPSNEIADDVNDPSVVSPDLSTNEDAGDDMNDPSVVSPDLSTNEDAGDDMNDPSVVSPDLSANEDAGDDMNDPSVVSPDLSVNKDVGDDMNDPSIVSPDVSANEDAGDDMINLAAGGETQNQEDISSPLLNEPPTVDTETPNPNIVDTVNDDFAFFNERLRNVLSNTLPESLVKLEDPTSPQSRALEWLRLNPPTESESKFRPVIQKFVLLVFYFSTNGDGWFNKMGWLSTNEECKWFSTASSGSICDQHGRLIEIDLRSNNLNGSLPMELVLLKEHMKRIRVNGNSLKGTLPSAIREMTNLERFHVHWNSFSGTIPTYLGGLTALKSLRLGHNDFVGTIPWQLGDLPNIDALNFESNELTGTLPSILGDLTNLSTYTFLELHASCASHRISAPNEIGFLLIIASLYIISFSLSLLFALCSFTVSISRARYRQQQLIGYNSS